MNPQPKPTGIVAMLRVKNEARWIDEVLAAALLVCDAAVVLDDHSTDRTAALCRARARVEVYDSAFDGIDEARDKNWLLHAVAALYHPVWVLAIDGDELLASGDQARVLEAVRSGRSECYSLQVLYLWDRPDQVRTDGVYANFRRPSLFRYRPGLTFKSTGNGGNFHCGNVPEQYTHSEPSGARLLHYGYMGASDRARKFAWYNAVDPGNTREDHYRHMIQGDLGGPAPHELLKHAGPLQLETLWRP